VPGGTTRAEVGKIARKAVAAICGRKPYARRGSFRGTRDAAYGRGFGREDVYSRRREWVLALASKVEAAEAVAVARRVI